MKQEIATFIVRCMTYQKVKAEHQYSDGPLQPLSIPEWKWEHIIMDFILGLPQSRRYNDNIWVAVDRLTKSVHFQPIKMIDLLKLAKIHAIEIVRLH